MTTCKHCGERIENRGSGWIHAEGAQRGKHRCALDPYGYDAAPDGEPCSFACRGYEQPAPPLEDDRTAMMLGLVPDKRTPVERLLDAIRSNGESLKYHYDGPNP